MLGWPMSGWPMLGAPESELAESELAVLSWTSRLEYLVLPSDGVHFSRLLEHATIERGRGEQRVMRRIANQLAVLE